MKIMLEIPENSKALNICLVCGDITDLAMRTVCLDTDGLNKTDCISLRKGFASTDGEHDDE